MNLNSEAIILDSWRKNAAPWTTAVRANQTGDRTRLTNRAILDTVLSRSPRSVLDVGCGEGWLARELAAQGIDVIGIDGAPELIEHAKESGGGGDFRVVSYDEVSRGDLDVSVDAVVCNFALFGKESVDGLFRVLPSLLNPRGRLIVQTLHPIACGDIPYQDGWRNSSWAGFGANFPDPAPWYFRTLESWITLFETGGFRLTEMREPRDSERVPASVIFCGETI